MTRTTILLAAALLASAAALPARADEESKADAWAARITSMSGDVQVKLPGESKFLKASDDMALPEGAVVKAAKGASAEIAFDGDCVIQLQPGSTLEIAKLDRKKSSIKLNFGTLLAKLRKLTSTERFEVRSMTAVAAVRGTEFGFAADDDGASVGVFDEGSVAVTRDDGSAEVLLQPNQESQVKAGASPTPPQGLKYFAFHREQMKKIRKRLTYLRENWQKKNDAQRKKLKNKLDRLRKKK